MRNFWARRNFWHSATCLFLLSIMPGLAPKSFGEDLTEKDLTEKEYQKLREQLTPDAKALWRSIPWKTSLLDAQKSAGEQKKPIFIWAMDGHPLGCT